jgi:hypothetical protein
LDEKHLDLFLLQQVRADFEPEADAAPTGMSERILIAGLASKLKAGLGLEVNERCVAIGNAVAQHLGASPVEFVQGSFAKRHNDATFGLVMANDVHTWIEHVNEDLGACQRSARADGVDAAGGML